MIITKKLPALLLIFSLFISFCSCTRPVRVDYSELLRRMEKELPDFSLETENAFYSDGRWFLFVSGVSSDDILLVAKEDDSSFITEVAVSVINEEKNEVIPIFIKLCEAAGNAFIYEEDVKKLLGDVFLYDEKTVFSENTYFAEAGRYDVSLFNADIGSTLTYSIKF